jgi:hypothetical protein
MNMAFMRVFLDLVLARAGPDYGNFEAAHRLTPNGASELVLITAALARPAAAGNAQKGGPTLSKSRPDYA